MELKINFTENTIYLRARINSVEKKFILDTGMFTPLVKETQSSTESKIFTLNGIISGQIKEDEISLGPGMTIRKRVFHTNQWDESSDGVMPFSIIEEWLNCIDFKKGVIRNIKRYDKSMAIDIDDDPLFINFNVMISNKRYWARLDTGSQNSFINKDLAKKLGLRLKKSGLEDYQGKEFLKLENNINIMLGVKEKINATGNFLVLETPIDFRRKIDFLIGNDILSTFQNFAIIRKEKKLILQS